MKNLNGSFSILKKINKHILFYGIVSLAVFFFYIFYVNFSIDTIILFLSHKIFQGKWLMNGVFTWFNPHIYLGTPSTFDLATGNFHPFSLFYLFPYPFSFAIWMGASSFVFLTGFYLLFKEHSKTANFASLLTLILFFSGTGIFRASNPTIFLVIVHYGFFLVSLRSLRANTKRSYMFPLMIGILMTLSGHVQFVIYGYLLGFLYLMLFKIVPLKTIFQYFFLLFISTFWYFIFSLPLVMDSTRLTTSADYINVGNNSVLQYIQLFLPYIFGYVQSGSNWGPGPLYAIVVSLVYSFLVGFAIWKQNAYVKLLILLIISASLGMINLPFFRGAGQITILFHILGLIYIAHEETYLLKTITKNKYLKFGLQFIAVSSILVSIFASQSIFATLFAKGYKLLKHGQESLFFDHQTITAIGHLMSISFIHLFLACVVLLILFRVKKIGLFMFIYVILEGLMFVHTHCYFIPTRILTAKTSLPITRNANLYRIQTASDLIPYFGISTYMGDLIFRPPFSKEIALFNEKEEKSFAYLNNLFSYIPSTWIMTTPYSTVQGFNTFMLSALSNEFTKPSDDFRTEYSYIIERNSLFAKNKQTTSINSISSGHLTLNDPRWEKLGVRYFISDRPLKKYKLIENKNGRYIYENIHTLPIYRITDGKNIKAIPPFYTDPNQWKFTVSKRDVGREFQMVMNPGGFVATLNGKGVPIQKEKFLLRIAIPEGGDLVVRYSPVRHLVESVMKFKKSSFFVGSL